MALIPGVTVNHAAHIGGLLAGAGFGWLLFRLGRSPRVDRGIDITGGVLMVATFASIVLSLTSPIVRQLTPMLR